MQLLEKFKTNLIAIFGFLFSVVLANIVSDQPLDNIFTKDIILIMEIVLCASLLYFIICNMQLGYEVKKVKDSYKLLKSNYEDILEKEELRRIFKDDEMMNDMQEEIKQKRILFACIWIILLIAVFIIVEWRGGFVFKDILTRFLKNDF